VKDPGTGDESARLSLDDPPPFEPVAADRPPLRGEPTADSDGGGGSDDDDRDDADEENPAYDRTRSLVEWVVVIAGALVVALLIKTFLFQAFYIPSESMDPTLEVGDRVLVNKQAYEGPLSHEIHRGDLIVFKKPEGEGDQGVQDLIKRVVGLPGETVTARDNVVYIDGKPLDEPYLQDDVFTEQFDGEPIPEGHVFVMGDNRTDSRDSRFFGPIPEEDIVGRAFFRVWPPSEISFL
jgi:signal peptidase I